MRPNEHAAAASRFDLPEEVLKVLPSDPFEQLDLARKITSIALSARVSALESEAETLRVAIAEKDRAISGIQNQLHSLHASLSDASDKLSLAERERESLVKENASLSNTVKKLSRDVSKLEAFRKALMQSLQEDEETPAAAKQIPTQIHSSLTSAATEADVILQSAKSSSFRGHFSEPGSTFTGDLDTGATRPAVSDFLLNASQPSGPPFTPSGSLSAAISPTRKSNPISPRKHLASFTTRGVFDEKPSLSLYSSLPSGSHNSVSSSHTGSETGRARVDGKEFFSQVRSRLSHEQFAAFVENVKQLNSHNQTREEALVKAQVIFGADHRDLCVLFERLIARNVH